MRSVLPFKKCAIVPSSSPYTPFVIYVQAKKTATNAYPYLINVTAPLLHNNCSSQDGHLFQISVYCRTRTIELYRHQSKMSSSKHMDL